MKFDNSFTVPVPPDEAWPLLLDVEAIAPCLPGAEITETLGPQKFRGRARVKIGPVQLSFEGVAEIVDIDDAARTARVIARGAEGRGRGNASATVDFALRADPAGSRVNVATDVSLAGAVAQYGRGAGLLKFVADELIGQFAKNLKPRSGPPPAGKASPRPRPANRSRACACWAGPCARRSSGKRVGRRRRSFEQADRVGREGGVRGRSRRVIAAG
jgi:carbon monoxide dehydrogenase subunit G